MKKKIISIVAGVALVFGVGAVNAENSSIFTTNHYQFQDDYSVTPHITE